MIAVLIFAVVLVAFVAICIYLARDGETSGKSGNSVPGSWFGGGGS